MEDDKRRLYLIALELDLPALINLCRSSKKINQYVCKNSELWKGKLQKDFGFVFKGVSEGKRTPRFYYQLLNDFGDKNTFLSGIRGEKPGFQLNVEPMIQYNFSDLIEFIVEKGFNNFWSALAYSATYGNSDLFIDFISKYGIDDLSYDGWGILLSFAIINNHKNIVELIYSFFDDEDEKRMISQSAIRHTSFSNVKDWGLYDYVRNLASY